MIRQGKSVQPTLRRSDRAAVASLGVALTLLVHLLVISPLLFGGGMRPRTSTTDEGGATSGVPALTLVIMEDTVDDPVEAERKPSETVSALRMPARLLVPVGSFHLAASPLPPAIEEEGTAQTAGNESPDDGERALMFGRYLGQVTARIERAWLRPRTPIGSDSFTCLVQVEQDSERNVKEITLKECNGTTAWQLSLVRGIESASPFPAPPDPSVFSPVLTFQMSAEAFQDGGSADGYEPVTLQDTRVAAAQAARAFGEMMAKIRSSQTSGARIIDIRIEGTRATDFVPPVPRETLRQEDGSAEAIP